MILIPTIWIARNHDSLYNATDRKSCRSLGRCCLTGDIAGPLWKGIRLLLSPEVKYAKTVRSGEASGNAVANSSSSGFEVQFRKANRSASLGNLDIRDVRRYTRHA